MESYNMFTFEEALSILRDTLVLKNVEDRLVSGRLSLLDDITTAFQVHLPFNNMDLMGLEPEKRKRPTLEEVRQSILSGVGGLCYNLNVAMFFILKALGYDVILASVTAKFPRNHVVVYARDVMQPGDMYLVEAGYGYPTFRAVSMDFEDESPAFQDSFSEYKYRKFDGKIQRLQGKGDLGQAKSSVKPIYIDGWRLAYTAELTGTANIEDMDADFDRVFTFMEPFRTSFHLNFRIVQFHEKRAFILANEKLMLENESGELEISPIEGGDEGILSAVRRYFPVIPIEAAKQALVVWRKIKRF